MESNCKKYNFDHVYCHNNDRAYIRANTDATDIFTLLKENKQLKAMLLLHLDLIQEQSDQLMAKDKLLTSLKEENDSLKGRLENIGKHLSHCSTSPETGAIPLNIEIKTETPVISCAELIVPPIVSVAETIKEIKHTPPENKSKYKICDDNFNNDSIIGESNGKFISKIILQRVQNDDNCPIKKEETEERNFCRTRSSVDRTSIKAQTKTEPSVHNDNEDSFSCGSGEQEQNLKRLESFQKPSKRCGTLTTKRLYPTREWEDKVDDETNKEEAEALKSEVPNLEIPKWTIKEFTGLYSIEGTEDLSDDTFLKRHAKLEVDEKRRKKWDVQRIREQRTIERLKRRHCKEEIQDTDNEINSFYPSPDSIKFIQLTEEIPVQAFGDCIARITPTDFYLPWQISGSFSSSSCETSESQQQQSLFTFLKKRRRQHSSSVSIGARRTYRRTPIKN